MTHEIENAQVRLDRLREKKKEREYKEAARDAGFDKLADYAAWKVLDELRHLTISERRAVADAKRPKTVLNGGSIQINGQLSDFGARNNHSVFINGRHF